MDKRRLAIFTGGFIGPLSGNAVLAMIPVLKLQFGVSAEEILLSITFFMLPFAFFNLFSGTISDAYGRKRIIALGFGIYAMGGFTCALSPDIISFFSGRAIQGIGYAFVNPVLLAVLGDITPMSERGKVMGLFGAFTTAGIASGPMMAGVIVEYDWRWVFILIAIMALMVMIWIARVCEENKLVRLSMEGLYRNFSIAMRSKGVQLLCLLGFVTFLCYIGAIGFLSDFLSLPPLDFSESEIGFLIGTTGLAGIMAAPFGGRLVDRIGRIRTAGLGFMIMSLGLSALIPSEDLWQFFVALLILGTGTAFLWSSLLTMVVEVLPELKGTSSSLFNSSRFFGYALAPTFFAIIYAGSGFDALLAVSLALSISSILLLVLFRSHIHESRSSRIE